jgi:heptosyltransferase II
MEQERKKILIIKTGATGDVVRTTVLLHCFLEDEVWWVTAKKNIEVLPQKLNCLKHILAIEDIDEKSPIKDMVFDILLSLDDDKRSVNLVDEIKTKKLVGAYNDKQKGKIVYTEDSALWFDLSLISKYEKPIADKKKYEGKKSVQEYLYLMIGKYFQGQEYFIPEDIKPSPIERLVGIEARAGERWPTKRWDKYESLAKELELRGYKVRFFEDRDNIKDYIKDIAQCSYMITGDSLGMHFALALKIPTLALFTCTSANEIYGYNRMIKIVSPYLWQAFFKTTYVKEAVESISLEMVLKAFNELTKKR